MSTLGFCICSAFIICRWCHQSRLLLYQLLPSLHSHLAFTPSQLPSTTDIVCTHTCTDLFFSFLFFSVPSPLLPFPSPSYFLSVSLLPLAFLYLLPDWLSLVRWMCAFPGQMALLLLCVPGSHFNTRPPCLAWRAIAWGKDSTSTPCSKHVCCAANRMGAHTFFSKGVDSSRLCARYTDGFFL